MKADHIKIGCTYSDKKMGLRRVLKIASHIRTSGMREDAVGVSYVVIMAERESDIGTESSMELKSFATWAKQEIPPGELQACLLSLQAGKIARRLTDPQRLFLSAFDSDLTECTSVECERQEFRVAAACREKGLIENMPDKMKANERYFDVKFSPLGLAVLASVQNIKD